MAQAARPIILAHGIARFDALIFKATQVLGALRFNVADGYHYFKGIKTYLKQHGYEAHPDNVNFAGSVVKRSEELAKLVRTVAGNGQVDIIAHSMGGLDARHMIVDIPGMADKVASLTTIGTPHLGSPVADKIVAGDPGVIKLLEPIFDLTGIRDLTTESCNSFNDRAKVSEGDNHVVYRAYAASEETGKMIPPLAQLSAMFFTTPNDGVVSIESQRWHSSLPRSNGPGKDIEQLSFRVPADHLNELGWWDPLEFSWRDLFFGIPAAARAYEDSIKAIYLEIARAVQL